MNKSFLTIIILGVLTISLYFLSKNLMSWTIDLQIQNSICLSLFALSMYGLGLLHYKIIFGRCGGEL